MQKELFEFITNMKPEDYARPDYGDLGFREFIPKIKEIRDYLLRYDAAEEKLPGEVRVKLRFQELPGKFKQMCDRILSLKKEGIDQNRSAIIQEINNMCDSLNAAAAFLMAVEVKRIPEIELTVTKLIEKLQASISESEKVGELKKKAAGEESAATWTTEYKILHSGYLRNALVWITFAMLLGGILLAAIVSPLISDTALVIVKKLMKAEHALWVVYIPALAGLAVYFSLFHLFLTMHKNYTHLALMAKHRETIGKTYEAAIAPMEPAAKQAAMVRVLEVLFTPDQTALLSRQKADNFTSVQTLIESFKKIS